MRIAILTAGTRGDVQPFVALGVGFRRAGHEVLVCTHRAFESLVREQALEYAYLDDGLVRLASSEQLRANVEKGPGLFRYVAFSLSVARTIRPILRRMLEDEARGIRDADCIVYHPKPLGGLHLAEKLGVPGFLVVPAPFFTPTREFPNMLAPQLPLGGWYNRLSYSFLRLVGLPWNGLVDRWRVRDLELPRRGRLANDLVRTDGTPVPVLYCYSPSLVPPPADWPDSVTVTGFWFLDSRTEWRPPPALLEFLEAGPQPIYVGFGSMAGRRPRRLTKIVLEALARSGQRAVLASGRGGLEARGLPREVHLVEEIPHDWLFPRVRAVVHHGGAGTTAAGLRAGRPSVICPFFGDQPFWGRIVERSGAGPRPIPQMRLNARRLARAIRQAVEDPTMRSAAESLGRILRGEDGVGNAVRTIVTALDRR